MNRTLIFNMTQIRCGFMVEACVLVPQAPRGRITRESKPKATMQARPGAIDAFNLKHYISALVQWKLCP